MYYLGIDLGGTNIAAGVADENYRILAKTSRKTRVPCPDEEMCGQLAEAAEETLKKAGLSLGDIPWIGVGSPGTVNRETGVVEFANNLHFRNFPLRRMLEAKTGKKVIADNDANAAAFGEYKAGALRGAKNAVAITLGTGVGSGIIIGGKIYAGSNFAGGELGHTVIVANGRPCTCGRRGCWEAYASATGLIASTREAMERDRASALWKIAGGSPEGVDGRTAFKAMRAGDAAGKAVVDGYIFYLACGIANCINIFQPDILCLGGGISNEGEALLVPLRAAVKKEVFSKYSSRQTVICRAQLGNDAGILGAALLGESE
jgi:glucokinase